MAIQNIQTLVDKHGIEHISNEDYLIKYYNEALANLGQRNTNDSLLDYVLYNTEDIYQDIINEPLYKFIIYDGQDFYTLKESEDIDNIEYIYEVIRAVESNVNNDYIQKITLEVSDSDINNNKYIICNLRLNIISSIYNYINKDEKICDNLWIPINYTFGYISNGINKNVIYSNFKDVYINVIPKFFDNENDDYELENLSFYYSNIFYFKTQNYINTDVYQYIFKDNNIVVELKFTLPYVDENDYWRINNVSTNIQAKAHDAVNLNIILAYYYKQSNSSNYKFLSGINNINTNNINKVVKRFKLQNENSTINCVLDIPQIAQYKVTKENVEVYKILSNSTLVIIAKIQDIVEDSVDLSKFGDGYTTTIWKYNPTEDSYDYISIDEYGEVAIDFNLLTNFDNLLKYQVKQIKQVEPDNFLFSHIIFDQIYYNIKQEDNNIIYAYPVIQNIIGPDYNNKYINNMNFSLKYISNYLGKDGQDIYKIAVGTDNKYLKINNGNYVTNSLYQYVVNNKINYYNEYIPNYNIPVFDMSEFLIKDINTMNKYNIISFDYNGNMYYSYLGTSHESDKNILTLGTYTTNINLGENTLANKQTKSNFKIQETFNINFNNINANGLLTVNNDTIVNGDLQVYKFEWNVSTINNKKIISTQFVPKFEYYIFGGNNYIILNIDNIIDDVKNIQNKVGTNYQFGSLNAKDNLFICVIISVKSETNNITYYYKYNDLLVLDNLIRYLNLDLSQVTTIKSDTNDIIYINGDPVYMVSSNSILANNFTIVNSTDTGININISNTSNVYFGNMLYVTYIPEDKTLIVNEVQSNKVKSIWKIPTNI